jgi:type I restriction enzyme, S subunit
MMISARLPKTWRKTRLADCCNIVSGATPRRDTPKYWGGEIPWVTPKELSGLNQPVLEDTEEKITEEGLHSCSAQLMPAGSILFSSRAPIGHVAIAGHEMCTNQGFKSLIPGPEVDSKYLYWCMKYITPVIVNQGRGATFKEVSKSIVEEVEIPLPPLLEQRRIAAILDKADAIRCKRAEALHLADDFLKSAFLDMFGDPLTNPKGWPMHRLGNHLTFVTSGSRGWAKYYASTGARFIRSLDVQMNHISDLDAVFVNPPDSAETRRTRVCPNDVLLTITGSRIGRVAPVNSSVGEAYISQHVAILRLNDSLCSPFLSMFLSEVRGGQHQIKRMQYGQTKPGLNLEQLRTFEIPCPPLSMQDQFCSIWNKFDVHTQHHKTAKQQTEDLFNSLVQRAFCGEL